MTELDKNLRSKICERLSKYTIRLNNFIAQPPSNSPLGTIDEVKALRNYIAVISNLVCGQSIRVTIDQLKEPGQNIKEVTEKIEDAIQAIKDTNTAFKILAGVLNVLSGFTDGIQSGDVDRLRAIVTEMF